MVYTDLTCRRTRWRWNVSMETTIPLLLFQYVGLVCFVKQWLRTATAFYALYIHLRTALSQEDSAWMKWSSPNPVIHSNTNIYFFGFVSMFLIRYALPSGCWWLGGSVGRRGDILLWGVGSRGLWEGVPRPPPLPGAARPGDRGETQYEEEGVLRSEETLETQDLAEHGQSTGGHQETERSVPLT